jgi:hypothetical protein
LCGELLESLCGLLESDAVEDLRKVKVHSHVTKLNEGTPTHVIHLRERETERERERQREKERSRKREIEREFKGREADL